jgi:hypothetical protein
MSYQVKVYAESDYPVMEAWWTAHGWTPVIKEILPKLGLVVSMQEVDCDTPIVAGWLYMDNSAGVSWMEWVVSNPNSTAMQVYRGMSVLIEAMRDLAKSNNYGVMLTCCRQPSLMRFYEKNGFSKTDEGVTHLMMFTGLTTKE